VRWQSGVVASRVSRHSHGKSLPLLADIVAKVENRTTQKISRKLIFGLLYGCVALQKIVVRHPKKDFCNNIGTFRTWRDVRPESVTRSKADAGALGAGSIQMIIVNNLLLTTSG
jgi:hypothetical protein